jgi:hypothetical protein
MESYEVWPVDLLSSAGVAVGSKIQAQLRDLGESPLLPLRCGGWRVETHGRILTAEFSITSSTGVKELWTSRFACLGGSRDVQFCFEDFERRIHRPVMVRTTTTTVTLCFTDGVPPKVDHGNVILV